MAELLKTAPSVQQAVELALQELGLTKDEVQIEILQKEKKGFMGFGSAQAQIKVVYEDAPKQVYRTPAQEKKPYEKKAYGRKPYEKKPYERKPYVKRERASISSLSQEEIGEKVANAKAFLHMLFDLMDMGEVSIDESMSGDRIVLELNGAEMGSIIGRRGDTLDALQYLTNTIINQGDTRYFKVTLDSNQYREKRVETLRTLAKKIARTTVRTGRSCTLEPMNPYERRIIHTAVSEVPGAGSRSVGDEPYRKVMVISLEARRNYQRDGRQNKERRDGQNRGRQEGYQKPTNRYEPKRESTEESLKQVKTSVDDVVKSNIFETIKDKTPLYGKIELDEK